MSGSIARVGANFSNGAFIPQVYSTKMQAKFYAAAVVPYIANHDWEGDIKSKGDKVIIRKVPTIAIFDWTIGTNVPAQDVTDEYITLNIDKAKGYCFTVSSIDEYQADIALISKCSEDAAMQMAVQVDQSVLQSIYADVATANTVGTSIGVTTPTQLSSSDYGIRGLLQAGQVLDQNNVPRDGSRWAVLNPNYIANLKQSDLKSVLITGDNESPLRNGYVGSVDGMKIYSSNNLKNAFGATAANPCQCLVGHSSALAFASQFEKPEMMPNPLSFGTLVRGLKVYGYKTVKPEAMALLPAY